MEIQRGDQVQVNVAPFIGSFRRHKESVPCTVLTVEGPRVQVRTESPYREVTLWILSSWIEKRVAPLEQSRCSSSHAEPGEGDSRIPAPFAKPPRRSPSLSLG